MSVIQQSDPDQDRTKAARVTDEQGKRTVVMKGPISESFYQAMNQVLAKDSTSEIGYSFESLEDGTLVIDPSAPHGIRSEPGTDTQVIAYGQQAKDVSVQDAAEFAQLVAGRQEGSDIHLVLTGEGESENAQMLRAVASANSVPCHGTVQEFLDEITGKEPVVDDTSFNFSQEGLLDKVANGLGDLFFGKDRKGNNAIKKANPKGFGRVTPGEISNALSEMLGDKWLDNQVWTKGPIKTKRHLLPLCMEVADPTKVISHTKSVMQVCGKTYKQMEALTTKHLAFVNDSMKKIAVLLVQKENPDVIKKALIDERVAIQTHRERTYGALKGFYVVATTGPVDWMPMADFAKWVNSHSDYKRPPEAVTKDQARELLEHALTLVDSITSATPIKAYEFPNYNDRDFYNEYSVFVNSPKQLEDEMANYIYEFSATRNFYNDAMCYVASESFMARFLIHAIITWVLSSTKSTVSFESNEGALDGVNEVQLRAKEEPVDDSLTALDVGGQVRTVETQDGEKAVQLDEAYSQESLGKIMQVLGDFFGGIDRKIVIMRREVTELLNRSAKKDREAVAVGRRYINTRRGAGLAFGTQMCEDATMVTDKLLEITEPIKLFSELTGKEFIQLARYCDETISNMEQKRYGSGAHSIKEVRNITNRISDVVSPMFTERGIMANRYVLTSKLMLNNVILFPTSLGRDAYLPMIGRLADKGGLGVKGPSLCSVGEAEALLNNLLEVNDFLGNFMKHVRTLIAGREWDLATRIQRLRSSTIKTDTEGNNYVVSLSEEDDVALRYVIGILVYLESLARVMYHAVYPVLEVTFDYCKVSVEAAKKPEGA